MRHHGRCCLVVAVPRVTCTGSKVQATESTVSGRWAFRKSTQAQGEYRCRVQEGRKRSNDVRFSCCMFGKCSSQEPVTGARIGERSPLLRTAWVACTVLVQASASHAATCTAQLVWWKTCAETLWWYVCQANCAQNRQTHKRVHEGAVNPVERMKLNTFGGLEQSPRNGHVCAAGVQKCQLVFLLLFFRLSLLLGAMRVCQMCDVLERFNPKCG